MSDNFGNYSNLNDLMSAIANKFKAKVGWAEASRSVKKNLLYYDINSLKVVNTTGTWSNNSYTKNGVTFTLNSDNSITVNGTATATATFALFIQSTNSALREELLNKEITINGMENFDNSNCYLYFYNFNGQGNSKAIRKGGLTFTFTNSSADFNMSIVVEKDVSVSNLVAYPMIRLSSVQDSTYEPYILDNVELDEKKFSYEDNNVLGAKNLLPFDLASIKANNTTGTWNDNVYTRNGITYTVNSDGTVDVSTGQGTASNNTAFTVVNNVEIKSGKYILSGCPNGGSNATYQFLAYVTTGIDIYEKGSGKEFTLSSDVASSGAFQIYIYSGQSVNVTFKPMLRPASVKDNTYVPYAKTNKQLTDDVASVQASLPVKTSGTSALTGATSVTIQNANIHTTSFITPFADNGSNTPTAWKTMTQTEGQVVLTFDALSADTTFYLTIIN